MDVLDIRRAYHAEVYGLELLLEELGDQILKHLLPDVTGELLSNDAGGRFPGTEAGEFGTLLHVGRNAAHLTFNVNDRNGDFQRVLATFN